MLTKFLALLVLTVYLTAASEEKPNELGKCVGQAVVAMALCMPLVNELNTAIMKQKGQKPEPDVFKNLTNLCEKTKNCLAPLSCLQAQETMERFESSCEQLEILGADLQTCFPKFNNVVYKEKSECSKNYQFITTDIGQRKEAFTSGKSCVIEIVKKECPTTSYDYINSHYEKFVKILTTDPKNEKCQGAFYTLSAVMCQPMEVDLTETMADLHTTPMVDENDGRMGEFSKKCKVLQNCMEENCYFSKNAKDQISRVCDMVETAFPLGLCVMKMKREKTDLSKYKCLEGFDFYKKENDCESWTTKRSCTKTVLSDICKEGAMANFDKVADITASMKC